MQKSKDVNIYDRAVVIDSQVMLVEFAKDPKLFLEKIGALDGMPDFKGIRYEDGSEAKDLANFIVGRTRATAVHLGIPYADYCWWEIQH